MTTSKEVIQFVSSKRGATFTQIQEFVVTNNGLDYTMRDNEGRKSFRGYWVAGLTGANKTMFAGILGLQRRVGCLERYCDKVGKKYKINDEGRKFIRKK